MKVNAYARAHLFQLWKGQRRESSSRTFGFFTEKRRTQSKSSKGELMREKDLQPTNMEEKYARNFYPRKKGHPRMPLWKKEAASEKEV